MIKRIKKFDRSRPKTEHFVNNRIPFKKFFLLDENGNKLGIFTKNDAIAAALDKGLDLVIISSNVNHPVAKIMNYGKFKYQRKKKQKEVKSKQSIVENKEIRITPMIGIHDLEFKAKKAREFLLDGHRVKVSLKFRGRELSRKELGYKKHKEFLVYLEDIVKVDREPKMNGYNFLDMYLSKSKTKKARREEDNGKT